jgi:hypothetical protein
MSPGCLPLGQPGLAHRFGEGAEQDAADDRAHAVHNGDPGGRVHLRAGVAVLGVRQARRVDVRVPWLMMKAAISRITRPNQRTTARLSTTSRNELCRAQLSPARRRSVRTHGGT